VVENKSGANGNIAMEYVAKSAPDGYTILVSTDAVSTNPHVYKMDIDPLKSLVPVIELSRQPIALAANPSLGVATLAELTELVKKQPGLGFATGSGAASLQAVVGLWYAKLAGITLGFLAIQTLNLVRIISLYYLHQWNQVWFEWFHLYLWQALIVLDALVFWLIWLRWLPRVRPPAARAVSAVQ